MEYTIFTEPQFGATYRDQFAIAQAAERWGFDAFFRSDHYLAGGGTGLPGPTDAWTTLAGLARETSRIRLGTLVSSATFRHPGILAIQVAQVDDMSDGRVELGLGAGWFEREHTAYGIPFPQRRFDLLEEQLQIITGLWSTPSGETFSFHGRHYDLADSPALPKLRQSPIPLIIGGGGVRRTPEFAARFASEYNVGFPDDDEIRARIERVHTACDRIGRDPSTLTLSVAMSTFAGPDDATIARRAARVGERLGRTVDNVRDGVNIVGDADEIAAHMARYAALGIDRVHFQLLDLHDLEHVDYLGAEVLPVLRR